jgi:hypothetical protein
VVITCQCLSCHSKVSARMLRCNAASPPLRRPKQRADAGPAPSTEFSRPPRSTYEPGLVGRPLVIDNGSHSIKAGCVPA